MTKQEIAQWIKAWFKEHPGCKELNSVYEDFRRVSSEDVGKLTMLILGMDPLRYMTYIPDHMFSNCQDITSIIIPNNITSIGKSAFSCCEDLTSVEIPNSVTSIGNDAFYDCYNLTSIVIPDSVTSIGDGAFSDCGSLTSITIPNGVTIINDSAFYWCPSLTSITIPDSVRRIRYDAFTYCSRLHDIEYLGTMSQWHSIQLEKFGTDEGPLDVHCTDGTIKYDKNGKVIA